MENKISKLERLDSVNKVSTGEKPEVSLKSAKLDTISSEIEGAVEAEIGNVAEDVKDGKDNKGDSAGSSGSVGGKKGRTFIKALPTIEVLRKDIEVSILSQLSLLEKQEKQLRASPKFSPDKLSNVVKEMRMLKSVLYSLRNATLELLKDLWFKFVKKQN